MSDKVQEPSNEIDAPEQDVQEESLSSLEELEAKINELDEKDSSDEPDEVDGLVAGKEKSDPDDEEADEEDLPLAATAEKYEPNYKVKIKDEEVEIDKIFKPAIVSKEAEDKFRELYEKAHGLEHVKADRDVLREEYRTHKEALHKQTNAINILSGYLDQGDYQAFFKALNIPTQEVMKYSLTEAQKADWTPEQRASYDQQWEAKRRANLYEEYYNSNQSQLESLQQDQVVKDYTLETYRPEVKEFIDAFDQRNGQNAFRKEVAQLGTYHEKVDGEVLPIRKLVDSVMDKYAPFMQMQKAETQGTKSSQQVVVQRDVPVIPNTGPSGGAPVQKAITSLDDLEKLADSM